MSGSLRRVLLLGSVVKRDEDSEYRWMREKSEGDLSAILYVNNWRAGWNVVHELKSRRKVNIYNPTFIYKSSRRVRGH